MRSNFLNAETSMQPATFRYTAPDLKANWGKEVLTFEHNLEHHPLFSDEALARLIEGHPEGIREVSTMDPNREDMSTWRRIAFEDMSGAEILQCVRDGLIWINIGEVGEFDPRYQALIDNLLETAEAQVPGLKTFKRQIGVLISSPNARVYYHCDIPGQGLLQVRGQKTIWIYPGTERFLPPDALERVVLGLTTEEVPYHPSYDGHATRLAFTPGVGALWPLNWPHRVMNGPALNVSVTIEYWTAETRRHHAMNLANGVLRHVMGYTPRSRRVEGPVFWSKAALAVGWKYSGIGERWHKKFDADTRISRNGVERIKEAAE